LTGESYNAQDIKDNGLYYPECTRNFCQNNETCIEGPPYSCIPQPKTNSTPTPKHNDTKELTTTEIILIAVGGVVFSAFAGFAIYKGVQKYKSANGYTYVFQA